MNKFENVEEEDFKIVVKVVEGMIQESPKLMSARAQYNGKHKVNFRLRGMLIVGTFVQRDVEMRELELLLVSNRAATSRQKVVVLYGLGGIGKTQLAVEFARKHQHRYSRIFWLDGSSDTSLKQSFAGMMQRLPRDELTVNGIEMLSHPIADADAVVRECRQWLSLPSNRRWLLIVDNVDRDHNDREDLQAYNVKEYLPYAGHGSVLITSRLASLQRVGAGVKIGTVAAEQARAILESNAGRVVKDADVVLELLDGLPLALTQAGSYIREANASASTYAKRYNTTWEKLMKKQNRFPLEEYGDRSVLTTWIMSYKQAQRQSEEAACLLKLWGFLDSEEMWYELIAAGLSLAEEMKVPAWLLKIAEDELEFGDAAGLLLRYSLLEAIEDTGSYSMHSVLHRWCGQLAEDEERYEFCRIAAGLVAFNVPSRSEAEFWKRHKRILTHGIVVSEQIETKAIHHRENSVEDLVLPGLLHGLGYLLAYENPRQAEKVYQRALEGYEKAWGADHTSTLDTVHNIGLLYANLGRLEEAERMYQRALNGNERALGPDHTSTLNTVNNMGLLYTNLGRLDQAEKMYQRALYGYEKAVGLNQLDTYIPSLDTMWSFAFLYECQGREEDAQEWYCKALSGYEKVLGMSHSTCRTLRDDLAALESETTSF